MKESIRKDEKGRSEQYRKITKTKASKVKIRTEAQSEADETEQVYFPQVRLFYYE